MKIFLINLSGSKLQFINFNLFFWLHFALIVPLLTYIGIKREKTHPRVFDLLLAVYHGVRVLSTIH